MSNKLLTLFGLVLLVAIGYWYWSGPMAASQNSAQASGTKPAVAAQKSNASPGNDTVRTDGKMPKITFPETEFDFGTISQQTKVSHTFKVKNTGDAPLNLIRAKGS
jgi:hypothetical protein